MLLLINMSLQKNINIYTRDLFLSPTFTERSVTDIFFCPSDRTYVLVKQNTFL